MNDRLRWLLLIALAHGLLLAILFKGVWNGAATFVTAGDSIDQSFMWLAKIFAAARQGELALWDFNVMSGISFAGELQTSPFYPLAWIAAWLLPPGTLQAFDTFLVLHFGIAALGMAALVLKLGLSPAAAFAASVVFAYGTSFTLRVGGQPNLFASLSWLPWVACFFVAAVRPGRLLSPGAAACGAGTAIALSLLAGHAHSTVLALIAAGCLLPAVLDQPVGQSWKEAIPALAGTVLTVALIAGVVAVMLALPQILATKEYLELAYKWYGEGHTSYPHVIPIENFIRQSVGFRDLATLLTGGQVRAEDGGTFFFTRAGLLLSILAILTATALKYSNYYRLLISIAIMIVFAITFSFAFVKPFAYVYMNTPAINLIRSPPRALFIFGFGAAILVGIAVDMIQNLGRRYLPGRFAWASVLPVIVVLAAIVIEVRGFAAPRTMHDIGAQSGLIHQALESPVAERLEALSRENGDLYRFYAPRNLVAPNIGDFRPVMSAHGYRSSRPIAYHEFFDFDPHSRRMDALSVRWWVSDRPVQGLRLLAQFGNAFLHERPTALPVLWQVQDGDGRGALPIADVSWRENDVTFRFSTPQTGRFVFAQTVYPGWRALLDGRPVRVSLHADLQSVVTEVPVTTVHFVYDPPWWRPSALIAALTALAIVAIMVLGTGRRGAGR